MTYLKDQAADTVRAIGFDYNLCDLEQLEDLYENMSEDGKKRIMGLGVLNFLLNAKDRYTDDERYSKIDFQGMTEDLFPDIHEAAMLPVEYVKSGGC